MTDFTAVAAAFAPFETLASSLLHRIETDDGSHDIAHLARVWSNGRAIQRIEGGNPEILAAATLLHDCVAARARDAMPDAATFADALKAAGLPE